MAEDKLDCKILLIGGSAGSLEVIIRVLQDLKPVSFPIVFVIHRKSGEDTTLENLLALKTKLSVQEVEDKTVMIPGSLYIAPSDYHLLFDKEYKLALDLSQKVNHSRPSIDVSMQSAAEEYKRGVVAILLSGANSDGSEGLFLVKKMGGFTVIQNPEDAEVSYMPKASLNKSTPNRILNTSEIAAFINGLNT